MFSEVSDSVKVLITGERGFTGRKIFDHLIASGYQCAGLNVDITDFQAVRSRVDQINPTHVLHLAAISNPSSDDARGMYLVNQIGTLHLLESLKHSSCILEKVVLASSAAVYGSNAGVLTDELTLPMPSNHYGVSKFAMELLVSAYSDILPVQCVRPFNYTGVGQGDWFVVPKIVNAFVAKKKTLKLGNIEIEREFNDLRDVVEIYTQLLFSTATIGTVNLCSGSISSIKNVISIVSDITGQKLSIELDKKFMRKGDLQVISGNPELLSDAVNPLFSHTLEDTLEAMVLAAQARNAFN